MRWPRFTVVLATAVLAGLLSAVVVLKWYGGGNFFPGLVAGFLGSLLAFVLALTWERERESRRARETAADLEQRRATEVRRRLEPVAAELRKNAKSFADLRTALDATATEGLRPANPQLLEGAWTANAPRLTELVADYKVISDLATTYGRIEELRWRIRRRTDHLNAALDGMIGALVDELRPEVAELLERVRRQISQPDVQPVGLIHSVTGTIGGRTTLADLNVTHADGSVD